MPELCEPCKKNGFDVFVTLKEKRDKSGTYPVNQDQSYHLIKGVNGWVHVFNKSEYEFVKSGKDIKDYPREKGAQSTALQTPPPTDSSYLGKIEDYFKDPKSIEKIKNFNDLVTAGYINAIELQKKLQPGLSEREVGVVRGMLLNLWIEFAVKRNEP